jgi:hypothetical protein
MGIYARKLVFIGLFVFLMVSTNVIFPAAAAENSPPQVVDLFSFTPEWGIEASDSFSSSLGALGVGVSFSFSYSLDAGISLPVSLEVAHSEYVLPNSTSTTEISAYGDDSARAWLYASGGFDASLDAGIAGSFSLVDKSINLGDEVIFTTPVGTQETDIIEADMSLGSQTISLLFVSLTIELRLMITSSITTSTSLTSQMSMVGDALEDPVESDLEWTEEGQSKLVPFTVSDETGTYIDMSFDNVTLYLHQLIFNILSFTVYLVINGDTMGSVTIPLPGLSFNLAAGDSSEQDSRTFRILADASGSTRDLGSRQLSIHVGVPFIAPAFLSPGFLLMIVPAVIGITYGRKRETGSKALGSVLLLIVLFGAALNLGLSPTIESGIDNLFVAWVLLIFPNLNLSGDIISLTITYLPWILAGLAIGGATKRPHTGVVLGFGIPLVMFLVSGYLWGGIPSMINLLTLNNMTNVIVAGGVSAILGGVAGYICRSERN